MRRETDKTARKEGKKRRIGSLESTHPV